MPRIILITGASNGIGAALALHYAAPGITLGLVGRNQQRLEAIAERCRQQGATIETGLLDITDTANLQQWLRDFDNEHPVELLIANAGVTSHVGENGESWQAIQHTFAVNLQGTLSTVHAILDAMRARDNGQIALVSSLAAYRGMPVTPAYCASKAAVKSYGEALRGWLAPQGIRVNVICPGFVQSDMSDSFPGSRPFLLTANQAARLIANGLQKNRAIISFPFPLNLGMWFVGMLPFPVASFFLGLFGYNRAKSTS